MGGRQQPAAGAVQCPPQSHAIPSVELFESVDDHHIGRAPRNGEQFRRHATFAVVQTRDVRDDAVVRETP
ncbi:MAG: hypothetical protein QM811_24190 [Pirellulales bacterium]